MHFVLELVSSQFLEERAALVVALRLDKSIGKYKKAGWQRVIASEAAASAAAAAAAAAAQAAAAAATAAHGEPNTMCCT